MSKKQLKPKVFKGTVVCPTCKLPYDINTTNESLLTNPLNCFRCFMTYNTHDKAETEEIIKKTGTVHRWGY